MQQSVRIALLNILFAAVSAVVALGLGEVVVRLKNADMRNYDIEMWRYAKEIKIRSADPILDHEHRPNVSAVLESVTIRTNAMGLRGGPVPAPEARQRRILFLGSSITLGWGVPEELTVTSLLEKKLRQAGENAVVMNAGVGNYNAVRYTELFFTKLYKLRPTDIVVHYFLRDAEELAPGGGDWFLRHSELAVTLWIAAHRLLDKLGEGALVDHYHKVYSEHAPGFLAMQASLQKLSLYAHAHHIRLYLAVIPDIHDLDHYQLEFAHRAMSDVARRFGYVYVDLRPAFDHLKPQRIWAMPGDPHPNALGHKLMADALFPVLHLQSAGGS
jgi:lysophospholipase L1-like esterase